MPKTALIVEDEIFVALDLERILMDAGYSVAAIAADRSEALEAAPHCSFAFVDIKKLDGPTGPAARCVGPMGPAPNAVPSHSPACAWSLDRMCEI